MGCIVLPKRCRYPNLTVPVNVTLFRNRVFTDDQVKMTSLGWTLVQYDCVLTEKGNVDPGETCLEDNVKT